MRRESNELEFEASQYKVMKRFLFIRFEIQKKKEVKEKPKQKEKTKTNEK